MSVVADTLPLKVMLAPSVVSVRFTVVAVKVPAMVVPPVWVKVKVFTVTASDKVKVPVLLTVRTSNLLVAPMMPVTLILPLPVAIDRLR